MKSPFASFVRDSKGAAGIEFALMAALVVCLMVLTLTAVGNSTDGVFETMSTAFVDGASATKTAARTMPDQQPAAASAAASHAVSYRAWGMIATAICMVGTGIALQMVQRRRVADLERRTTILPVACPATQATFVSKRQDIFRSLLGDLESFLTDNVRVRHLMTTDLITVPPTASRSEMLDLMHKHEMRHLLVVAGDHSLKGVVSDRDLRPDSDKTAGEIMTPHPHICSPETPIRAAVTMLLQSHISSLPVMEGEKLVGIVTMSDVGMALQCMLQLVERVTGDMTSDPKIAAALIR